jgi:hypothetical protein
MFDDDVNVHYLFVWLQECPQFRSHVVQRTRSDQEEPQDLLSPDWRGEGPGGLPRLDPLQTRQSAEVDWASGHLRPSRAVPAWSAGAGTARGVPAARAEPRPVQSAAARAARLWAASALDRPLLERLPGLRGANTSPRTLINCLSSAQRGSTKAAWR